MKVILPVLFGQDFDKTFLINFAREVDDAIVLGIIDTERMSKESGSEMASIAEVERIVERIEDFLIRKGINTKGLVQWGEIERIIINTAKIHKADKVVLVFSPGEFFPKVVRNLKKDLHCTLDVV